MVSLRSHDKMFREVLHGEFTGGRASAGGFAVLRGRVHTSSIWLNMQSSSYGSLSWQSDDSKYLSRPEEQLVRLGVKMWKAGKINSVIRIPDELHSKYILSPDVRAVATAIPSTLMSPVLARNPGGQSAGVLQDSSWALQLSARVRCVVV